jgi:hypothetical protein
MKGMNHASALAKDHEIKMNWMFEKYWRGDRMRALPGLMFLVGVIFFVAGGTHAVGEESAIPPSFVEAFENHDEGKVIVQVKYGLDGKVEFCRIIRSNAPLELEVSTVAYIQKYWRNRLFAGNTQILPITYETPASRSAYWNGDMVPPPNLVHLGEAERDLKLRLTFGSDGWVKDVQVIQSSGSDSIDDQTAIWVKVHWHHKAYANQVIDAPFRFVPPSPEVVVPKPKPPLPPPPAAPIPIPAIRAE